MAQTDRDASSRYRLQCKNKSYERGSQQNLDAASLHHTELERSLGTLAPLS